MKSSADNLPPVKGPRTGKATAKKKPRLKTRAAAAEPANSRDHYKPRG